MNATGDVSSLSLSEYWRFTGLEWILLEIHRAGMTFTGNALADMNLLEESPGCYEFSWRFTGLERTQHQGTLGCNGFNKSSPGCNGFNCRITGLLWVNPIKKTTKVKT
jgi:hypothetical protein